MARSSRLVVDVNGRGVPAWIDVQLPVRSLHQTSSCGTWCVRRLPTNGDGRFTIDIVPDGLVWLSAFAPGVGSRTFVPCSTPSKESVVIQLGEVPGAGVRGTVRDGATRCESRGTPSGGCPCAPRSEDWTVARRQVGPNIATM